MLNKIIKYFLENKLVTLLILIGFIAWGIVTAPFGWQVGALPSDPVPVDYLLGIPGVKSIRSSSIFGFSSIFIIFSEDVEFYWSRSRILEKLSSLPSDLLPEGVQPALGPDATALGQVYWYTIEGRDKEGKPTGGWDLHEIRTV